MLARIGSLPWKARLIALASIWGSSFLLIKVGDESLAPLQVALSRLLFGSLALLVILGIRREPLPRGWRVWGHLAVVGLLFCAIPFTLFAWGETRTTSVLAGIWNATTPLFTLAFGMADWSRERPTRGRATGLAVGFAGVLVVLGVWQGLGGRQMAGNLACVGAAVCYATAFNYTRRFLSGRTESVVALAAGQVICGTVAVTLVTPFFTSAPAGISTKLVLSMAALGALGTGIAYVINLSVIRDAGPSAASTVTYGVPMFATLEGMIFLGEPLTWFEPLGAVIVILGVAMSQGALPARLSRKMARSVSLPHREPQVP